MIRYKKNPRVTGSVIEVDGKKYPAKYIGKGQFSRVFRVGDRVIYYTKGDCSKEALATWQYDRMAHLPEIVRHENITMPNRSVWYVFSSPYYRNVTMKDKSAWLDMKNLVREFGAWWDQERGYQYQAYGRVRMDIYVMQRFVDYLNTDEVRKLPQTIRVRGSIVKALQEIVSVVSNCDSKAGFDFQKSNFGVNEYGTLIFRDPVYVME
jgi:hypothetical protein